LLVFFAPPINKVYKITYVGDVTLNMRGEERERAHERASEPNDPRFPLSQALRLYL
jgi:hypothetical protein